MRCGIDLDGQDIFVEADWMKGHKPSRKALELVMRSFYRACRLNIFITLHIDDGCMGGGTSIPHEDPITHETNYLSMDGEHSLKDTYFDRLGQHVFFYCIQCHRMKTEDWGGVHYESSWGGRGGGGMFIQCQDAIGSNTVHLAHNFMHELGNCIGLSGKTYWDDAKQEWIYLCTGNCAMNPNTKEAVDYCSDCWTDIDLAGATRL